MPLTLFTGCTFEVIASGQWRVEGGSKAICKAALQILFGEL